MTKQTPAVYLAHASEDKEDLARPIAEYLLANGIEVWFDEWEIRFGDSLRQRMEEGLGNCTHFLILITKTSITKSWVNTEIDAGFADGLAKRIRFMGVRIGVEISEISPLLRTRFLPQINLDDPRSLQGLVEDIFEKSHKPPLGNKPHYVTSQPSGLESWSAAVISLADYIVKLSETGCKFDPQLRESVVASKIDLTSDQLSDALQDLKDAGLIECSATIGSDEFWPTTGLFVRFDRYFMPFDPESDARAVALKLVERTDSEIEIGAFHKTHFADWSIRRLNSSLNCLEELEVVRPIRTLSGAPYTYAYLFVTDRTCRFIRRPI